LLGNELGKDVALQIEKRYQKENLVILSMLVCYWQGVVMHPGIDHKCSNKKFDWPRIGGAQLFIKERKPNHIFIMLSQTETSLAKEQCVRIVWPNEIKSIPVKLF